MKTPQQVLSDYLGGINQVLDSNPPEEDKKELKRIKSMFSSSISSINLMLRKGNYVPKSKDFLESNIEALDLEIFKLNKKLDAKRERISKLSNKVYSYKIRLTNAGLINGNDLDIIDDKAEFLLTI